MCPCVCVSACVRSSFRLFFLPLASSHLPCCLRRARLQLRRCRVESSRGDQAATSTAVSTERADTQVEGKPPLSQVLNLFEFEAVARKCMSQQGWVYYSSGSDDEITLRENHSAFHRLWLRPRILVCLCVYACVCVCMCVYVCSSGKEQKPTTTTTRTTTTPTTTTTKHKQCRRGRRMHRRERSAASVHLARGRASPAA